MILYLRTNLFPKFHPRLGLGRSPNFAPTPPMLASLAVLAAFTIRGYPGGFCRRVCREALFQSLHHVNHPSVAFRCNRAHRLTLELCFNQLIEALLKFVLIDFWLKWRR